MPHSGLQREVLSLYRKLLRAAQRKQPQLIQHVKGNTPHGTTDCASSPPLTARPMLTFCFVVRLVCWRMQRSSVARVAAVART